MTMRTYEFDDEVMTPEMFRFHVIRTHSVRKGFGKTLVPSLIKRQRGECPLCGKKLRVSQKLHVDHVISVKQFAHDLAIPLTEAYKRCHAMDNLRVVHASCNNARNRKKQK